MKIISIFSLNGFFLIPSTNSITTFPPSNGGKGNKLVTPKEIDGVISKIPEIIASSINTALRPK